MKNKKVVLAFSGGLDTSFCAVWLNKIQGMEVHAVLVNTGGFHREELRKLGDHASALGVKSFKVVDQSVPYYDSVIRYLIFGNILKNNSYPLSVSAERMTQAIAVANYSRLIGADHIAHGSTGAGNDQVRFDMVFNTLIPEIEIITPIRDKKLSREEEIIFLKSHGDKMNFEKVKYSINKGIWGTSVGGKETLTSNLPLPEEAFPTQVTKTKSENIILEFHKGDRKS